MIVPVFPFAVYPYTPFCTVAIIHTSQNPKVRTRVWIMNPVCVSEAVGFDFGELRRSPTSPLLHTTKVPFTTGSMAGMYPHIADLLSLTTGPVSGSVNKGAICGKMVVGNPFSSTHILLTVYAEVSQPKRGVYRDSMQRIGFRNTRNIRHPQGHPIYLLVSFRVGGPDRVGCLTVPHSF